MTNRFYPQHHKDRTSTTKKSCISFLWIALCQQHHLPFCFSPQGPMNTLGSSPWWEEDKVLQFWRTETFVVFGISIASLPLHLSPLLSNSFLPPVPSCLLGVESVFLQQEIKSMGHLYPQTLAWNRSWQNNVCSLICIFRLNWILDSFCFFLT